MERDVAIKILGLSSAPSVEEAVSSYIQLSSPLYAQLIDCPLGQVEYLNKEIEKLQIAFKTLFPDYILPTPPPPSPLTLSEKPFSEQQPRREKLGLKTKLISFTSFLLGIFFLLLSIQYLLSGKTKASTDKMEHRVAINRIEAVQDKYGMSFRIGVLAAHLEGQPLHLGVYIYHERAEYVLTRLPEYRNNYGQLSIGIDFKPLSDLHEEMYPMFIPYKAFSSLKNSTTWKLSCLILIKSVKGDALATTWHDFTLNL